MTWLILSFSDTTETCNSDSDLQHYLYVLILGQLLHGLGGTTLYTVGVSLIDDSVSANSSPMYIGKFVARSSQKTAEVGICYFTDNFPYFAMHNISFQGELNKMML